MRAAWQKHGTHSGLHTKLKGGASCPPIPAREPLSHVRTKSCPPIPLMFMPQIYWKRHRSDNPMDWKNHNQRKLSLGGPDFLKGYWAAKFNTGCYVMSPCASGRTCPAGRLWVWGSNSFLRTTRYVFLQPLILWRFESAW